MPLCELRDHGESLGDTVGAHRLDLISEQRKVFVDLGRGGIYAFGRVIVLPHGLKGQTLDA
ncbi:MAG: hypothetical protein U9Q81_03330 [Pseudomonadota bacterium]|nr:hypothetical protein [Pseudomonadota bacterium]